MSLINVRVIVILFSVVVAAANAILLYSLNDRPIKVSFATMEDATLDGREKSTQKSRLGQEDKRGKSRIGCKKNTQKSTLVEEENTQKSTLEPDYTNKDFCTDDEGDTDTEGWDKSDQDSGMGQCLTRKRPKDDLSDCSYDDEDEDSTVTKKNRRMQSSNKGPAQSQRKANTQNNQKKYKQTTLNFQTSEKKNKQTEINSKGKTQSSKSKLPETSRPETRQRRADGRPNLYKRHSDKDTEKYRLGYPGQKDDPALMSNLMFYRGEIASCPNGAFIDQIHEEWWGNFELLERHHGYIQWLFPIREEGMNWQAQALQLHEAKMSGRDGGHNLRKPDLVKKAIVADKEAHARVITSYRLMLDFYGMELDNEETGELLRSPNWRKRFENLNFSSHNYLRITRILKSLGEFDLEHLKKPFLVFILKQIFEKGELQRTLNSLENYWIGTLKNDEDRAELYDLVERNKGRM